MILSLLLQAAAPPTPPAPGQRPQPTATMVVEPVAAAIAGWDADGDGRTTRAEMEAGVRRSFGTVDTGASGRIGYIGFADWAERWLGDRNALPSPFEVDTDADDRVTLAEMQATFARIFDRLDRDKDGVLVRAELLTIRAQVRGSDERRGKKGRRGDDEDAPSQR